MASQYTQQQVNNPNLVYSQQQYQMNIQQQQVRYSTPPITSYKRFFDMFSYYENFIFSFINFN